MLTVHEKFHVTLVSKQTNVSPSLLHPWEGLPQNILLPVMFRAVKFKSEPNYAHQPNKSPNDHFEAHAIIHVFRPVIDDPSQCLFTKVRTHGKSLACCHPSKTVSGSIDRFDRSIFSAVLEQFSRPRTRESLSFLDAAVDELLSIRFQSVRTSVSGRDFCQDDALQIRRIRVLFFTSTFLTRLQQTKSGKNQT